MEARESMGLSGPPSFSAILQQQQHQQQHHQQQHQRGGSSAHSVHSAHNTAGMPPPASAPAGAIHAPAAMRPAVSSVINIASNPSSAPYASDSLAVAVAHGVNVGMGMGVGMVRAEPLKRKRGRPRKYGPDGSMALALAPMTAVAGPFSPSQKRGRGRPPGSGRKQQLAALGEWLAGSAGVGFTPHVITIVAGEDVATKIMSFSHQGPRAVCILSANGAISNVTLRQTATSGGTVTYEGRFEILSLSGSFLPTDNGGSRSRTGGLSVSLAGPDGRVIGGGVAGMLMAATPVQVVVGSFITNGRKAQAKPANPERSIGLSQTGNSGGPAASIPISRGTMDDSSGAKPGGPSSSLMNQGAGASISNNAGQQPVRNIANFQSMGWSGPQSIGDLRRNTDINIPLPSG
uniref:AT-hook motif nuclear-localized protein n=1 Tax=Araucaria cunninghamii TaxID=56994 RepID=A0A0D6R8S0_ARACU